VGVVMGVVYYGLTNHKLLLLLYQLLYHELNLLTYRTHLHVLAVIECSCHSCYHYAGSLEVFPVTN
jgi:hypothetical protein